MPNSWRRVRRLVLTPSVSQTSVEKRRFHVKNEESKNIVETVGRSFLAGYAVAAEAPSPTDAEIPLETVALRYRGFAYEGAAMALAMIDALSIGRHDRVARFLAGRADAHVYMAYVGVGWAMARLPRSRWTRVLPADPLLGWLALDGYGFHQAYFHPERYVRRQFRDERFAWGFSHHREYANRVIDQGIGRALWFVEGTDVDRVAATIDAFPLYRQSDLYSGSGLAATYAGGATEAELERLWYRAGEHRPAVVQGAAFAAKARMRAGLMTDHTRLAASVFCGSSAEEAAAVTDAALVDLPADGPLPGYEIWRQRIANQFVSLGRC